MPAPLARSINSGSSREPASDGDVILFVKKYICDTELAQEPLLVLKESRASNFSLVPDTKILVGNTFNNLSRFYFTHKPRVFYILPGLPIQPQFNPEKIAQSELLRRENNHKPASANEWQKLANAVEYAYGHRYQRSLEYLQGLIHNSFWRDADLVPLPWLSAPVGAPPPPGQPQVVLHQAVLNALAPSVPLRAVFSRQ